MKSVIELRVAGLDAIVAALPDQVAAAQATSAARLLDTAQTLCPVDTGRLRESGHIDASTPLETEVIFSTEYVYFVHFGTRYHAANPFLQTAVDVELPHYQAALRTLIEDLARTVGTR